MKKKSFLDTCMFFHSLYRTGIQTLTVLV